MGTITYGALRKIEKTGVKVTATDLQLIASDDSVNALATSLSGFLTDQWVKLDGWVRGSNSGWYQVKSNSTSSKILTLTPLVDHLRLPGVANNLATTPDSVAASVLGDIDLRARLAMVDWSPAVGGLVIGKTDGGANKDYRLDIAAGGVLEFVYTTDGTTTTGRIADSTVSLGFDDGSTWWIRVTYVSSSGLVKFFTSSDGLIWTQLGANVTITSGAIHNGSGTLNVGTASFPCRIYYAEVRNGVDGLTVAALDPSRAVRGATTVIALTGETWTVSTSGTPPAMFQGPRLFDEGAEYYVFGLTTPANAPDSSANSITTDIDLRASAALTDWSPAVANYFICKDDGGSQRDYWLRTEATSTGRLVFGYTTDGTTVREATSTSATTFTDGAIGWVRATYVTGTGVVQFFISTDGKTWTQLGNNVTLTAGAIHNGIGALVVAARGDSVSPLVGKLYYAEVRSGVNGPVVASFDPGRAPAGATSLVAYTGETWTIIYNGAGTGLVRVTAITITGYKRGLNQSYQLEFYSEQSDRNVKVVKTENQPLDDDPPETIVHRRETYVTVMVLGAGGALLAETDMPQWREMLASTEGSEPVTFDRYGSIAVPDAPVSAILPDDGYDEVRMAAAPGLYKLKLMMRVFEDD